MDLGKIKIFIYSIFSCINKYSLKKIDKFLEPIGLKEIINNKNDDPILSDVKMINESKYKDYKKGYEDFKNVVEEHFDASLLHNFYYNSEWVKVSKVHFMIPSVYVGTYDFVNNKLKFKNESLYHELFHLCSTDYDSTFITTGFSLDLKRKSIGTAINEGYTDLLTQRYFYQDISNSYLIESKFAYNLEKIIGQKKMEKLYMEGNFFGFIEELNKYYKINEIEKFLIDLDVIGFYCDKNLTEEESKRINLLIEDCICFLIKGYCKFLKNKTFSIEDKKMLIEDYFYDMKTFYKYYYEDYKFNFLRINKIIEDNLSKEINIDFEENKLFKDIK